MGPLSPTAGARLRGLVAVVMLITSVLADIEGADPAITSLLAVLATMLAALTRLELIVGTDLDGDGHIGPRPPRSRLPIWLVCALAPVLAYCGGSPLFTAEIVHAGIASTGSAHVVWVDGQTTGTVDGEAGATVSVEVCAGRRNPTCAYLSTWATATGELGEPATAEACASVGVLWMYRERCIETSAPPSESADTADGSGEVSQ